MTHTSRTSSWTKSGPGLYCTPARQPWKGSEGQGALQAGALCLHCPPRQPEHAWGWSCPWIPSAVTAGPPGKTPRVFFPATLLASPAHRQTGHCTAGTAWGDTGLCWKYSLRPSPGLASRALQQAACDHGWCWAALSQALWSFSCWCTDCWALLISLAWGVA